MEREGTAATPSKPARIFNISMLLPDPTSLDDRIELQQSIRGHVARIGGIILASDLVSAAEVAERGMPDENGDMPYDAPFHPDRNLFDPEVQEALNTPIENILAPGGVDMDRSLKGQLKRLQNMGYVSARDLILGGSDYLRAEPGIHEETQTRLREGLRRECPDVPMRNSWRPEDVARFCKTLDEVPLYALRGMFFPNLHAPLDRTVIRGRRESVNGFLDRARNPSNVTKAEGAYNVKASALAFAVAFEAKRRALEQSEG